MKISVLYFKLKLDNTQSTEIYEIKGNKFIFRINIFMLFILWCTVIYPIGIFPYFSSLPYDDSLIGYPISIALIAGIGFFMWTVFMSQFTLGIPNVNHSAWYIHKIYLTSKYRCKFNEDIQSFGRPKTDTLPLKYIDSGKLSFYTDYNTYGLMNYLYRNSPFFARKLMKFSINIYWFLYFGYWLGLIIGWVTLALVLTN